MSTVIVAVLRTKTTLQFAAATIQSGWQPQWQKCIRVVLTKSSNPIQIVEQLCGGAGEDPSLILVCQPDVRSLLLPRYAHDTVRLVNEVQGNCRALWWPVLPASWAPALRSQWRAAGLIYVHAWGASQAALLAQAEKPPSADDFFDQFRYRPAAAQAKEVEHKDEGERRGKV
jgi:hypothetical protein